MDKSRENNVFYFERLPQEIHDLIFSYFHTPTDFYNLIRASPLHFRIYFCDKERYLQSILSQSYDRVNLILALRILVAGRPLPSLTEDLLVEFKIPGGASRIDWILHHLTCHGYETRSFEYHDPFSVKGMWEEKCVADQEKPVHTAESTKLIRLRQLCRLWRLIDYFIHDYSRQALKQLKRICLRTTNKSSFAPSVICQYGVSKEYRHCLTRHEYDRMQRAFLYFELYRRLFGGSQPHASPEVDREDNNVMAFNIDQFRFSIELTSYENAELASIYDYVAIRMTEVFDRVKSYVASRLSIGYGHGDAPVAEYRLYKQLSQLLENTNTSRPETVAFLVELGLPFCRRFFFMPAPRQAAVIHRYRTSVCHSSLSHALFHSIFCNKHANMYKYEYDNRLYCYLKSCTFIDRTCNPSPEQGDERDKHDEIDEYDYHTLKGRFGLGRAGLFFWDDERTYDLWSGGRPGWFYYVGCFLWKEALRKGLEVGVVRSLIREDFSNDAVPGKVLSGVELLGEVDDQDGNDDDFARLNRESQRPDVRQMPVERLLEEEIDSFDY